ncbi:MAG: ribonuclease [Oscillospiraceae bacterium]|nr:ribonuclease [Oscillospiraceae bacterium]
MATPATQESFVELPILPQETQSTTVAASTEAAPIPEETEVARSETAAPETARPTTASETEPVFSSEAAQLALSVTEDGVYDSKEEVALYIHSFGHLPSNYITKKEAEKLGWPGGELEPYAPGKCIGGSRFGNYEGLLPDAEGRSWTECDIDTLGAKSRGAKRIVFSNDGLIYYTGDHYEHFELLYGEEG